MEIASLAVSSANFLLGLLTNQKLRDLFSSLHYESQLKELHLKVKTVQAVLLDAEKNQEIPTNQVLIWIQQLKEAVYEADDLFDEFVTLAQQNKVIKDGNPSERLCLFFSYFRDCFASYSYSMAQRVEKISKKFDIIASNHNQFGFRITHESSRTRKEDFCRGPYHKSDENYIIGRDDDVKKIVSILSESDVNTQQGVSFLSIVGIGGLGKTALAKFVFNHKKVESAFPKMRVWTCVSDHDQERFDVDDILREILGSVPGEKREGLSKEEVKIQLREILVKNKYLLVLDGVWTENCHCWLNLEEFLQGGERGSWIVITTRSHITARNVTNVVHKLQGLSEKNSWHLFIKVAFGLEKSDPHDDLVKFGPHDDLVKIGQKIVEMCAGVPLALRVVGSLLHGEDKRKWKSILKVGLANIQDRQNDIMPILKLSFHYLESHLKSCFTYCALFPKDFAIDKNIMLSLWMAQGYVVPLDENQSTEDAAEEYFSILLHRCFFQDIEQDEFGEIVSCKIHDLMHDMAQNVAGKEICITDFITTDMDEKVRHVTLMRSEFENYVFTKTHIRTYLQIQHSWEGAKMDRVYLEGLFTSFTCVRALDLRCLNIKILPSTIGGLLHLRYLNLSDNKELEVLPKSIKKLYNLETLKLSGCKKLKELPKHLSKLVNLRVLDISSCESLASMPTDMAKLLKLRVLRILGCNLTCMPCDLGKLINLHTLQEFVLSEPSSSCKEWFDLLEDLKVLKNLKGKLSFRIQSPKNGKIAGGRVGGYLKNKEYLNSIFFSFSEDVDGTAVVLEEALMEELQPHSNLKSLELWAYHGVRMPSWDSSLTNLVRFELTVCLELQHLTCLGDMHLLEELRLGHLLNLEYITDSISASGRRSLKRVFFYVLPKLKGWVEDDHQLCLPELKSLEIDECRELIYFPSCPLVENLKLSRFNDKLRITTMDVEAKASLSTSSSSSSYHSPSDSFPNPVIPKLSEIFITGNLTWLKSLPCESFQQLTCMKINGDNKVESLGEVEEVFRSCSSLKELSIYGCDKLKSLCGGLVHLTALKMLKVVEIPNLTVSEEKTTNAGSLHSLQSLILENLLLVKLPDWIQYLASLETLKIFNCKNLESIPDWMSKLTSLGNLYIFSCSAELEKRCQDSTGEDWSYIQHIDKVCIHCKVYGENGIPPAPPFPDLPSLSSI